jgi:glycosyltransferase involved in cell wall biosynthesis
VCVSPDPKNPFNNVSTMNKVVEYMAMGKPIVAFDLHEVRDTARGAGLYIESNDPEAFGDQILKLLDSPETRQRMGEVGLQRFNDTLAWEHQEERLVKAYDHLLGTS